MKSPTSWADTCKCHCWRKPRRCRQKSKVCCWKTFFLCVCFDLEEYRVLDNVKWKWGPRRRGCGVVTCGLTHASCSSLTPQNLLTVMSFDSCHLWVLPRNDDMNSVFIYLLSFVGWEGGQRPPPNDKNKLRHAGIWKKKIASFFFFFFGHFYLLCFF